MELRTRRITRAATDACKYCGLTAQVLIDHPRPTKWEREGVATLKDNCIVTSIWRWCATLKEIYPPDEPDEGEAA